VNSAHLTKCVKGAQRTKGAKGAKGCERCSWRNHRPGLKFGQRHVGWEGAVVWVPG
jgi:hypothetical protein